MHKYRKDRAFDMSNDIEGSRMRSVFISGMTMF